MALRLVQGFGAGAEYGGAVIMAVEHAPPGKRGLFGSFAPMGVTVGILLANGVFAIFSALPKEEFLTWGWRMPFLFSIVLILVGFYIRSKVSETPVFSEIAARNKAARSPVAEAVQEHPREFVVVLGARLAENGLGYLFPVFALNYMTQQLHLPKSMILQGNMLAYAVQLLTIPRVRDAVRPRRPPTGVYLGGALFSAVFAFPFFMLIGTQSQPLIYIGLVLGIAVGVAALCSAHRRRTLRNCSARGCATAALPSPENSDRSWPAGPRLCRRVAADLGQRPALGVAAYMIGLSLITAVAVYYGPETYRSDISADTGAGR